MIPTPFELPPTLPTPGAPGAEAKGVAERLAARRERTPLADSSSESAERAAPRRTFAKLLKERTAEARNESEHSHGARADRRAADRTNASRTDRGDAASGGERRNGAGAAENAEGQDTPRAESSQFTDSRGDTAAGGAAPDPSADQSVDSAPQAGGDVADGEAAQETRRATAVPLTLPSTAESDRVARPVAPQATQAGKAAAKGSPPAAQARPTATESGSASTTAAGDAPRAETISTGDSSHRGAGAPGSVQPADQPTPTSLATAPADAGEAPDDSTSESSTRVNAEPPSGTATPRSIESQSGAHSSQAPATGVAAPHGAGVPHADAGQPSPGGAANGAQHTPGPLLDRPSGQTGAGRAAAGAPDAGSAPRSAGLTRREPVEAAVSRGLAAAMVQRGGSVTLRLSPESLGSVRIELNVAEGAVSVRMDAADERAHGLLSGQAEGLRSALEARGLSLEKIEVRLAQSPSATARNDTPGADGQRAQTGAAGDHDAADGRSRGRDDEPGARQGRGAGQLEDGWDSAGEESSEFLRRLTLGLSAVA